MRTLTPSEKRTVRFGAVAIAIYLILFGGVRLWGTLGKHQAEYRQLTAEAEGLKYKVQLYEDKVAASKKLMESFHLDPVKLVKATVVAEASAAVQKAAAGSGIQLGPVRESPARPSSKELGSMQMEGFGPVPAVMGLLHRIGELGYPLIVDAVQITSDPTKPGMIKMNLTILILDFEQWKKEEATNV